MVAIAQTLRSRDRFGVMTPEEIAAIPGTQQERWVQTEGGKSVYIFEVRPDGLRAYDAPMILNFHGGGFVKGRTDRDHRYCADLAWRLGCLIWDIDYCLAPENPFPAAYEESYAVAAYAFAHAQQLGVDSEKIALAGHSAGGNLVAVTIRKALETNAFRPCCALMEYFPANHSIDPMSRYTHEQLQDERNVKRGGNGAALQQVLLRSGKRGSKKYFRLLGTGTAPSAGRIPGQPGHFCRNGQPPGGN